MFVSLLADIVNVNHDTLEGRFKDKPNSLLGHLDHSKIAYNNDLRKLVAVQVASRADIQGLSAERLKVPPLKPSDYTGDVSLLHAYAAKVAKESSLDADQVAAALSKELTVETLKEIYESLGQDHIEHTLEKSRARLSQAFNDQRTKQMAFIVVINETDYAFRLTDQHDMLDLTAVTFGHLYPKEVGKDDTLVSWGVWATGSGSTSGAASSIKVATTYCPPGGSDFYFIASASCPAWTPTNTLALKVYGGTGGDHDQVVRECKDNESVSSQSRSTIDAKSPDGRCFVTAHLGSKEGKRAFVVVRITYYQVSERDPKEAAGDGNLFNSSYGPPSLRTVFSTYFDVGKAPNSIPGSDPVTNGPERPVWIVTHDIPALLKYFDRDSAQLNAQIEETYRRNPSLAAYKDKPFPNPGFHWGVLVGEFVHELNAEANGLSIVYQNRHVKSRNGDQVITEGGASDVTWQAFELGTTTCNDEAIRQAGENAIAQMKGEHGERYDPWNNNCQVQVKKTLAVICKPGYKSFNGIADAAAIQSAYKAVVKA